MHQLKTIIRLPVSLDEAWNFFSNPSNLAVITPKELNLVPRTELPQEMYPGIFIEYFVRPILGIPMRWVTEISHIQPKRYFIDEQRFGPYKIWHHQHFFKAIEGGIEMTDIVDYRLPFGILGQVMHKLFLANRIKGIFEFRKNELEKRFGIYQN